MVSWSRRTSSRAKGGFTHRARLLAWTLFLGSVAGLVALHAWLLWIRLAQGQILDPAVSLRWSAAALLLVVLLALRHAGVSMVRGRKALAYWGLVLLLHATIPGLGPEVGRGLASAGPIPQLLFVWPASVAPLALALFTLGLGPRSGSSEDPRRPGFCPALTPRFVSPLRGVLLRLSPRAPPA